jgi:hypothetical protein
MIKIIAGGAAFGLLLAIVTWLVFVNLEPKAAATVAKADAAAAERAISSPFELMANHGKTLPVEHWPAF